MTEEEIERLRGWRGFGNIYIRVIEGVQVVVLAGNTRNETLEVVKTFRKLDILYELFRGRAKERANPFVRRESEQIIMKYKWEFEGKEFELELPIPKSLINYYKGRNHNIPKENWNLLASDPLDDPVISTLVWKLIDLAEQAGYRSEEEVLKFVIRFVQALPYGQDVETAGYDEYPRFPVETLVDGGGDCEDTSILMASILMELGYEVVLFLLPGHVGVGVGLESGSGFYIEQNGTKYYYLETTGYGWNIGELPTQLQRFGKVQFTVLKPKHVPVPLPVISRAMILSIRAEKGLVVDAILIVENLGQIEAVVNVIAGFKGAGVLVIHTKEVKDLTVPAGEVRVVSISLKWPEVIKHRWIVIRLIGNGKVIDEIITNF